MKEKHEKLLANGYYIIPIKPKEKAPAVGKWQDMRITAYSEIKPYLDKGCGIGILTGVGDHPVCGVDIDSMDEGLVEAFITQCPFPGPIRIGNKPKALMLFATSEPKSKLSSRKFLDAEGRTHQLEVLGKGQQFVAYGTHPEGHKYLWVHKTPLEYKATELQILTPKEIRGFIEVFETLCLERGYAPKSAKKPEGNGQINTDDSDPFDGLKQTVGLTVQECEEILSKLDVDDYDMWLRVGMALHHEFNGSDKALKLWDKWSSKGTTYKNPHDLKCRWDGFGKGSHTLVTMRSLQFANREAQKAQRTTVDAEIRELVATCKDYRHLMDETAKQVGQTIDQDPALMSLSCTLIKDRFRALTGGSMGVRDIRKAVSAGQMQLAKGDMPEWCKGWVYVAEMHIFFNTETGVRLKPEGFKGFYDSEVGEGGAVACVLNENIIPKVARLMYLPSAGRLFKRDGITYANTYISKNIPDLTCQKSDNYTEHSNIFKHHIKLMIGGGDWTRECQLFCNFLRYIAENPGNRVSWAVLLQGAEGDGKSIPITRVMARLLGHSNTTNISAQTIESSIFTDWAENHRLGVIEEIKLHGHNRFDILNKLKAVITNEVIEIHPKGFKVYTVPNTGNYYLTTNYKDALPIASGDRRYMILFSQFPAGLRKDTKYFDALYGAIDSSDGTVSIGQWLLSIDYHEEFKPQSHAPETRAKELASAIACDDVRDEMEDLLESSDHYHYCKDYVLYNPFITIINSLRRSNVSGVIVKRYL